MKGAKSYSAERSDGYSTGYGSRAVLCRSDLPDTTKITISTYLKNADVWIEGGVVLLGELRDQANIHPVQYASRQHVVLDERWTYDWRGDSDLEIGERVIVPATEYMPSRAMTVTALTSDYDGYLVRIIGRVSGGM